MSSAGAVVIDVGFIQHIESALAVDCADSPSVIAPLAERDENRQGLTPQEKQALDREIDSATDGSWLELWELHAIQRLRGWHRARYGSVTVDRGALREVCNVLDVLTCALGNECDETLCEVGVDRVRVGTADDREFWPANWRSLVLAAMKATGYCGDCLWCQVCRLHDQCAGMLHGKPAL